MAKPLLNPLRHAIKAYKFTVTSKDDKQLLQLKQLISQHNASIRRFVRNHNSLPPSKLLRVSLMARGKRRDKFGRRLHSNCDSNLRHEYASHFDVYIHDSSENHELRNQIETGLTPTQQRKARKIENTRLQQEWQDDDKLRKQGVYFHYIINKYGQRTKQYMSYNKYVEHARNLHPNMPEATFNRIFSN